LLLLENACKHGFLPLHAYFSRLELAFLFVFMLNSPHDLLFKFQRIFPQYHDEKVVAADYFGFVESRNLALGARDSNVHSISKISLENDYCTVLRKIRVKFNGTVLY
jgi:hypothetical protein